MKSAQLTRRIALVAGGAAIIGMGTLTACSTSTKEAPTTSTPSATSSAPASSPASSATTSPSVESTEKVITQKPIPSIEDRGGMDSHGCPPGQYKINGNCV